MKGKTYYSYPILCDRKKDLSKSWYIEFYFQKTANSERKRVIIKSGKRFGMQLDGNRLKNKKQRQSYFNDLLKIISSRLNEGWDPFDTFEEVEAINCMEALDYALSLKKNVSYQTFKDYKIRINAFKKYLDRNNLSDKLICEIKRNHIHQFLNSIKNTSGKNYNNYLKVLKLIFNLLIKNEFLIKNPVKGITKLKAITKQHKVYSAELLNYILNFMKLNKKDLYLCCLLD